MKTYYHIICMRVVGLRPDKANYNWTWYRAQSILRAWLHDKVAAEIWAREKGNMIWNSMRRGWSCTITAARSLMIIYGYNYYKHQAKPVSACSRGTRWKEPVVQIQISYAHWLERALMPKCHILLVTTEVAPWLLISTPKVISVSWNINNCSCFSS